MSKEEVMGILATYPIKRLDEELDDYDVIPMYFTVFGKGPDKGLTKMDMLIEMRDYRDSELKAISSFSR